MRFIGNTKRGLHYVVVFQGDPSELQEVWDRVCEMKMGDAMREPVDIHPVTHKTTTEFSFSNKGAAAMIKLAFS